MKRRVQRGLSVSPDQNQRIKALAARQQISEAAVVRKLIDAALPFAETGQAVDHGRLITLLEFASLALDTLIHRLSPADAEPLLERAIANARTYHAPQGRYPPRPDNDYNRRHSADHCSLNLIYELVGRPSAHLAMDVLRAAVKLTSRMREMVRCEALLAMLARASLRHYRPRFT